MRMGVYNGNDPQHNIYFRKIQGRIFDDSPRKYVINVNSLSTKLDEFRDFLSETGYGDLSINGLFLHDDVATGKKSPTKKDFIHWKREKKFGL